MARVFCPECGTEFEVPSKKERDRMVDVTDMDVSGYLVPKKSKMKVEDNNMREIRFNEVEAMNNNNNNKGDMKMNNSMEFSMEKLMELVDARIAARANESVVTVSKADDTTGVCKDSSTIEKKEGAENLLPYGKNSKFYGKKLCGHTYDPYMVPRFEKRQFIDIMKKYNLVVEDGYKFEYPYMKGIKYMMKELYKLVEISKKDIIAYKERSLIFTPACFKEIFLDYLHNVLAHIDHEVSRKRNKSIYFDGERYFIESEEVMIKKGKKPSVVERKYYLADNYPIEYINKVINKLNRSYSYKGIYEVMKSFPFDGVCNLPSKYDTRYVWEDRCDHGVVNDYGYKHHRAFVSAFKLSGVYYTTKMLFIEDEDRAKKENKPLEYYFEGRCGTDGVDYLRHLLDIGTPAFIIYAKLKDSLTWVKK